MTQYFDPLETRSPEARSEALAQTLPEQIARAQGLTGYAGTLDGFQAARITEVGDLARLPVLRKSDMGRAQGNMAPFGGLTSRAAHDFSHIFQSPGPIYEPGGTSLDWWRMGRFLHACGVGSGVGSGSGVGASHHADPERRLPGWCARHFRAGPSPRGREGLLSSGPR